ncbi:EAL domain-containing protein [soil metagenome]
MLTVYNCIVNQHDLRLVGLAVLVCALASFTAVNLLHHVEQSTDHLRTFWLTVSAISIGFGIWSTHFIAMVAFSPAIPSGFGVSLTAASLIVAVALTGIGMDVATRRPSRSHQMIGGAVIGIGIAVMHFTGMAAFDVQAHIVWDPVLAATAVVTGIAISALATVIALQPGLHLRKILGAVLLTAAIVVLHFTAMASISIYPDSSIVISDSLIQPVALALSLTASSIIILSLACITLWLDLRDYRRSRQESERMRELANAAVEGLLVCEGDRIVAANDSVIALSGRVIGSLNGETLDMVFPDPALRRRLLEGRNLLVESPLRHANGQYIPVEVVSRRISYAGKVHLAIAIRDLSERKKAEADVRHLALHDTLTGLPNRRSFAARLDSEMLLVQHQPGKYLALLCLDLDRFKEINDLFGHAAGDAMLQKVARCASSVLREGQTLARLGGDEFAVIAPNLSDPTAASRIADDIIAAFAKADDVTDGDGLVSASIGIAICPNDATEREILLSHADKALYRAKAEGRNTYRFYELEMGIEATNRRQLEHDLRHAVARGEFHLVYQPQKQIGTGETMGFEALLRWQHPARGNIPPATFIPIAEESGIIVQIGEWVLAEACREAARWTTPLTVAVNASAVQLLSAQFPQTVHTILLNTGLPPARLEIEITETAMIRDMHRALATLRQLKALGIQVAMDDFGTGFSSLANLRAFPFDKIKIDGSFIKSVDSNGQAAAIVRAVLGLGRGLGLPVLAEGVETSEEFKFLSEELCQIGQGYFLGGPDVIDAFIDESGAPRTAPKPEDLPHQVQRAQSA